MARELVRMRKSHRTKTKVLVLWPWHKEERGTSVPWFAKITINGTTEDEMFMMYVETAAHGEKNADHAV